jgi:hypothetical protein
MTTTFALLPQVASMIMPNAWIDVLLFYKQIQQVCHISDKWATYNHNMTCAGRKLPC